METTFNGPGAIAEMVFCLPIPECPPGFYAQVYEFDEDDNGPLENGDYTGRFSQCAANPFTIDIIHNRPGSWVDAPGPRIYDSSISGGADPDLEVGLGNLVIIQEDNEDLSIPDDNGLGGTLRFTFDNPTTVLKLAVVDFEERSKFKFYDQAGAKTTSILPVMADGEYRELDINKNDLSRLDLFTKGSGGISSIEICCENP